MSKRKVMIEKIIIWLRKQEYSESSISCWLNGKFYVVYPDGRKSAKMYWKHAKDYCWLFGGAVFTDIKGKQVKVWGRKY